MTVLQVVRATKMAVDLLQLVAPRLTAVLCPTAKTEVVANRTDKRTVKTISCMKYENEIFSGEMYNAGQDELIVVV